MSGGEAGVVRVVGRFPASAVVALVRVDGPHVLRAGGGQTVERRRVDSEGAVEFPAEVGARYFVVGQVNGSHVEVRATGTDPDQLNAVISQAPVGPEPRKFSSGEVVPALVSGATLDGEEESEAPTTTTPDEPLSGAALKDRARELDIKGRGSMTAAKLRAAVRRAEKKLAA